MIVSTIGDCCYHSSTTSIDELSKCDRERSHNHTQSAFGNVFTINSC